MFDPKYVLSEGELAPFLPVPATQLGKAFWFKEQVFPGC